MMIRVFACVVLAVPLACHGQAVSQPWPAKSIRIVSPFPPGGGIDASARIIGQALTEHLGQPVVVENRAGAGGRIGTEMVAKAAPDGYTLLLGSVAPNAIIPSATPKLAYDAVRDFAPISLLASTEYTLVVHPNLPARSVRDLLKLAKARPEELTFASSGNMVASHLAGELLNLLGNVKTVHVAYKGTGLAAVAVISGETLMTFGSGPSVTPLVNAKKLRAVATTGGKRSAPDLPTMGETLPGYEVTQWYGLLAPAGTPPAVLKVIHSATAQSLQDPKVSQRFAQLGCDVTRSTPQEFGSLIRSEMDKWGKVIRSAKIQID